MGCTHGFLKLTIYLGSQGKLLDKDGEEKTDQFSIIFCRREGNSHSLL